MLVVAAMLARIGRGQKVHEYDVLAYPDDAAERDENVPVLAEQPALFPGRDYALGPTRFHLHDHVHDMPEAGAVRGVHHFLFAELAKTDLIFHNNSYMRRIGKVTQHYV